MLNFSLFSVATPEFFQCVAYHRKSITLDGDLIFDRATEGRFPEVKEIKQLIRDKVSPSKDLGHSDG